MIKQCKGGGGGGGGGSVYLFLENIVEGGFGSWSLCCREGEELTLREQEMNGQ